MKIMKRTNLFLWVGIAVWSCLTFFIAWVLVTPDNPLTKLYRAPIEQLNDRVFTGPYPVGDQFSQLHAQGVTADVSLLDPKIPYERVLLHRERKNAERAGLQFYDFPVASILGQKFGSYYNANVRHAALTIDSLERNGTGKIYLHCYLGQHRMAAVRKILESRAPALPVKYRKPSI